MEKTRKRRIWTEIAVIVLILVGVPVLLMVRTVQHFRRNEELLRAVKRNDTQAALRLLEAGADANARDEDAQSKSILQRMLEDLRFKQPPPNLAAKPVLFMLMQSHFSDTLKKRVPDHPENFVLAKALLDHGADSNAQDDQHLTALMLAARNGYDATVRLLLERHADPRAESISHGTPIMFATGPCVETLMEYGADPQQGLMTAAGRGDVIALQALLKHNVDVNAVDKYGYTPLILAAEGSDSVEAVRLLLAHGAKIDARMNEGWTALMRAAWEGHIEVMKTLLEHGADVNAQNDKGWGPLLIVQRQFPAPYTRFLLDHGAHIDAQAKDGDTPLLNAVFAENAPGVQALLTARANVKIKNKSGETALARAIKTKQSRIVELLRRAGAKE